MGIITREPEALERAVHREALLEMKRLNDVYMANVTYDIGNEAKMDLFQQAGLDPGELYKEELIQTANSTSTNATIEEIGATDFYQYGLECRYLPLFRYLQLSKKVVLTADWQAAREELLFSRAFDRILELQSNQSLSLVIPRHGFVREVRTRDTWDTVLEQARWMFLDIIKEAEWKRGVAKELAEEAVQFLKLKFKLKSTAFHYHPEILNYLDRDTMIYGDNNAAHTNNLYPEDIQEQLVKTLLHWKAIETPSATIPSLLLSAPSESLEDAQWTDEQDAFLKRSLSIYTHNYDFLADTTSRSPEACQSRLALLATHSAPTCCVQTHKHHTLIHSMLPTSFSTRPPLSSAQASKKLMSASSSTHPSHEAAVRKANQSISKLLTPGELAMRRLQRNRVMAGELHASPGPGSGQQSIQSPISQ